MKRCPVCQQAVTSLGACAASDEAGTDGIVVNVTGRTFTVHVSCLEAFERMMSAGQLAPA